MLFRSTISTQPCPRDFRGVHFATFSEKLIEPMVLAGCPTQICKKCGKIRERIIEQRELKPEEFNDELKQRLKKAGANKEGQYQGQATANYPDYVGNPSDRKRRILKAMRSKTETLGWTNCGCNAGWEAGIVLDPFCGLGTVGVVAKRLKRNYIGIDISEKYCERARQRIKNQPEPLF